MTDNEIIKALEICLPLGSDCSLCPLLEETHCYDHLLNEVLDLFNRQKAEIERLQKFCDIYSTDGERAVKQFVSLFKKRAMATRKDNDGNCRYEVDDNFIGKLLKEVVGESDV